MKNQTNRKINITAMAAVVAAAAATLLQRDVDAECFLIQKCKKYMYDGKLSDKKWDMNESWCEITFVGLCWS